MSNERRRGGLQVLFSCIVLPYIVMAMPIEENGKLQERDKPFVLALVGIASLLGVGIYGIAFNQWEAAKDFLAIILPLVVMSWTFYYKAKS